VEEGKHGLEDNVVVEGQPELEEHHYIVQQPLLDGRPVP